LRKTRADGGIENNHKIQSAPALESEDTTLPVPPYTLGAWLGDGTSACARITIGERDLKEIVEELQSDRTPVRVRRNQNRSPTLILAGGVRSASLQTKLRRLGVLGNKHIPDAYFDAGTSQRWDLLQGLMDTDGTVNRCGGQTAARCSFTGTSEKLTYGVWRLARSLGLKATRNKGIARFRGRDIGPLWRVEFPASAESPVFRLSRKQALLPQVLGKRSGTLTITSCSSVESTPTKCLMVDSPDGLFLVGHGCVPTHNTTLAAFLLLYHLCGYAHRPNSQLFSAAQSRDQAAILFALAAKIARLSPELNSAVVVRDTAKQLFCPALGTLYRALSADASTAYGLSPVFTVHDELGQVRGPRSELYEALETASGAQEHPLSVVISTQAPTDADLLSLLIDDARAGADPKTKLFLYSADPSLDPFGKKAIVQANPAFGDFLNAEEVMAQAESARRMPSRENSYRNLILNQRVASVSPFISRSVWEACAGPVDDAAFLSAPVTVGLDLSARNDLTALAYAAQSEDGVWNVRVEFFAPEVGVHERAKRDRVPYDLWVKQGWITLTPGSSVDYEFVVKRMLEICSDSKVEEIAYDRWRIDVLKKEIERLGADLPLVEFGQGFKDMAPAVDGIEALLLNKQIRHGNNPALNWCVANAVTTKDPAGNRKLDKSKATGRIDGLIAAIMAMHRAMVRTAERSVYETRGIRFL